MYIADYTNRQLGYGRMGFVVALALLVLLLTPFMAASQDRELIAAGKREFQHSCVLCHGLDGRGESEMSTMNLLTVQLPDLRKLKKHNHGTFPFWQTYLVIDGRQEITAHGNRDMPIWGDTFIRQEGGGVADEARAVGRILQLLYYLESIQEK